jgi:hypothetical protein
MIEKLKYLISVVCNMFVGCLAGWLFIYADVSCAIFLFLTYIISLALFDEVCK